MQLLSHHTGKVYFNIYNQKKKKKKRKIIKSVNPFKVEYVKKMMYCNWGCGQLLRD